MRLPIGTTGRRAAVAVAAAALALGSGRALAQDAAKPAATDTVLHLEGAARKTKTGGMVESWGFDQVIYAQGAKKTTIPGADVLEIEFADEPREYRPALRALQAKDGETARKGFDSCLTAKEALQLRAWVTEYAQAGLGEALLILGARDPANFDKAVAAFSAAKAANAKSLVLDRILLGLGEAELARGRADAAQKASDELQTAAKTARRPLWEMGAVLLRARVQESRGNFGGAAGDYDEAVRIAESQVTSVKEDSAKRRLAESGVFAAVAKGWVLVAKAESSKAAADYESARSYFEGLAAKHPKDARIAGASGNAGGVVHLAANDLKSALRKFQATEVLYFAAPEEVARSLYYQSVCYERLGDKERRSERIRDLKEFFPKSEWARKVQ